MTVLLSPYNPAAARSRSRTNLAQEGEAEASSQESLQELMPEEVLVVSLGTGPQTVPGMMSENEVMGLELMHSFGGDDEDVINLAHYYFLSLKGRETLLSARHFMFLSTCVAMLYTPKPKQAKRGKNRNVDLVENKFSAPNKI